MEVVHLRKKFKKDTDENGPSHNALHLAAVLCKVTDVTELLNQGHKVDAVVSSGMSKGSTALHLATQFEHPKVIVILLERGADFTLENDDGDTPLHIACRNRLHQIVRLYFTALCTACSRLNPSIRKVLSKTKLPIDDSIFTSERCFESFKLLKFALQFQLVEVIEILLNYGIDIEARDSNGMSALHYLVRELSGCRGTNLNYDVIRVLKRALRKFTCIKKVGFYSCSNFKRVTKLFTSLYKDMENPTDNYGRSPLNYLYEGFPEQMDSSLAGMELFSEYNHKNHETMYASRANLIEHLLRVPAITSSLPSADREGNTILHLMASAYPNGRVHQEAVTIVPAYLESGGDIDAKTHADSTPLHFCIRRDSKQVTHVLLQYGADVNAVDGTGATPYSLVRESQPFWSFSCMSLLSYLRRLVVLGATPLCPLNQQLWERDEGIVSLAIPRIQAMHCTAEQCRAELQRMESDGIRIRELLGKRPHDLLYRTRNEQLAKVNFYKKYPIYGYMVINKMNSARWRAALVQSAKETLTTIAAFDMVPEACLNAILSHFEIGDLKVLIKDKGDKTE